jgi:hypothetical protein
LIVDRNTVVFRLVIGQYRLTCSRGVHDVTGDHLHQAASHAGNGDEQEDEPLNEHRRQCLLVRHLLRTQVANHIVPARMVMTSMLVGCEVAVRPVSKE